MQGVTYGSGYASTRDVGAHDRSSVQVLIAVRGIGCVDWSNTGHPPLGHPGAAVQRSSGADGVVGGLRNLSLTGSAAS